MGWTAARNDLDASGWSLFAVLFFWQIPHFLAIAWLYREDYANAGFVMLPSVDADGFRTGRQAVSHTFGLLFMSLLPVALGLTGVFYFGGAVLLGGVFLICAFRFSRSFEPALGTPIVFRFDRVPSASAHFDGGGQDQALGTDRVRADSALTVAIGGRYVLRFIGDLSSARERERFGICLTAMARA